MQTPTKGGKPSPGTPADRRLRENQGRPAKPASPKPPRKPGKP